jgi:HTH-type transcriptional regulator / antitoxin HipB
MQTINEQIRDIRRAHHLSQKALGTAIGLPQSHVSAIETGKVDPRLSNVIEMARRLDQEVMLVPRILVPAVRAMLTGEGEAPLWQVDDDEEDG